LSISDKRRLKDDIVADSSFLRRSSEGLGDDLSFLISSNRMPGNGSKPCHGRFRLDIRKH